MTFTVATRPPFPRHIDNSMRSTFISCPHKFFNKYIYNRTPNIPNVHLHSGGAFAKGMEVTRKAFFDGVEVFFAGVGEGGERLWSERPCEVGNAASAIAMGYRAVLDFYGDFQPDDTTAKTALRMADALNYYFSIWPLGEDFVTPHRRSGGSSMVECNFVLPLNVIHPETGEPLLYFGRFDMVGSNNGVLYIVDEKTTSSLGPTWGSRYDMSAQFTGYTWAMQQFGLPVGGVLIRGISILKEKYGHAQHIMYRPEHIVNRWLAQLEHDLERMIQCWRAGYWDYSYGDACAVYGRCDYVDACQAVVETDWLDGGNFCDNNYNPLGD